MVVLEYIKLDVLLIDRGVRQVSELVVELVRIIVLRSKSKVVFIIKPYLKFRFPRSDANPLSYIEFLLPNDQRRLDVLLSDPDLVGARPYVVHQIVFLAMNLYTSAPRFATWFHYPRIFSPI
jgi:hypothetical protein